MFSRLACSCLLLSAVSHVCAAPQASSSPAASVSAAPAQATTSPYGAVYLMNNEPDGNMILSHTVSTDGTVTFKSATPTGGKGAHGVNAPGLTMLDPLFSAGSVVVWQDFLFVVNAGSNTVSMFSISLSDPTSLLMIGEPVDTGLEFPVSIAVSDQSGAVCVLNGGAKNGVACFSASGSAGLTPLSNTLRTTNEKQTTPPSGPPSAFSNLIFSSDGTKLIAAIKGDGTPAHPGYLAMWDVNLLTGALNETYTTLDSVGGFPFQMNRIPFQDTAIFAADAGGGYAVYDYSQFIISSNSSKVVEFEDITISPAPGGAICWSAYSEQTGSYYVVDLVTSIVTEVTIDTTLQGHVAAQYPQIKESGSLDTAIGTINANDYLYVLSSNTTSIEVMSLGSGVGKAKHVQTYPFGQAVNATGKTTANPINVQGMATWMPANAGDKDFSGKYPDPSEA